MDFSLFDSLECYCGEGQLSLHNATVRRTLREGLFTGIRCKRICGFKDCRIDAGIVQPTDCTECRPQEIVGGTIRCRCGKEWPIVDGLPRFSPRQRPRHTDSKLRVIETDFKADPRWIPFVAKHPEGGIYHHPRWIHALEQEYGQQCLSLACEDENGCLRAILPLFFTRGFPLGIGGQITKRRLTSLPRTPLAGPLATDAEAARAVIIHAVECVRRHRGTTLQLKSESREFDGLVDGVVCIPWNQSYVLELPAKIEDLRFGNAKHNHRVSWAVKRAIALGVQVRQAETGDELKAWYKLYLDTRRRVAMPARSYRFFATLWELLKPCGLMRLILAETDLHNEKRLLAGSIFLMFGQTVYYAFTGCKREDLALHPNDVIQWRGIHDACREGFRRYDFGEVEENQQGLIDFKAKWCAAPKPLYRYYFPAPRDVRMPDTGWNHFLHRAAAGVWRRLPEPLIAAISDRVYGYL